MILKLSNRLSKKILGKHLYLVYQCASEEKNLTIFLKDLHAQLLATLREHNAVVVHERLFGAKEELLVVTELFASLADENTHLHFAVTAIDGHPCTENARGISGIQIEAVICEGNMNIPSCISHNGKCVGCSWNEYGANLFILQNLHGNLKNPSTVQTTETLDLADAILREQGVDYRSVVRTWIYLDRILDWYMPFNEARTTYYKKIGIMPDIENTTHTSPRECFLPASTGIRGRNVCEAACTIDLIAMTVPEGSDTAFSIQRLTNKKQKDAFRYGAAFSRAVIMKTPDHTEIQISGTAAIDETGESIHLGDSEGQIRCTLETIEALIAEAGFTLNDICSSTSFLKHREDLPILLKVLKEKGVEDLPTVVCEADVCRDNLLFEMDAIACK